MPKQPYDMQGHKITISYVATVTDKDGAVVFQTRNMELSTQAERTADDFLREYLGIDYPGAITLSVDNFAIGASNLFVKRK